VVETNTQNNKDMKYKITIIIVCCVIVIAGSFYYLGETITSNQCNKHYKPVLEKVQQIEREQQVYDITNMRSPGLFNITIQ